MALTYAAATLAGSAITALIAWRIHTRWDERHRYDRYWTPDDRERMQAEIAVQVSRAAGLTRNLKHSQLVNRNLVGLLAGTRRRRPIALGPGRRNPIPDYGSHQ